MFQLINAIHQKKISILIADIDQLNTSDIAKKLTDILYSIYADIPEKKRISYGRYSIIKKLGVYLYPLFNEKQINICNMASRVYENPDYDPFVRSLMIQILSVYGKETGNLDRVLPYFEKAAASDMWEIRECSAGFIRKLVKPYPNEMHEWYLKMVRSGNHLKHRFVSESIRPVTENRFLHKKPEYAFSILKHLFTESNEYPRTSTGNNLSDWMRINQDFTLSVVKILANSNNQNSYWIAYRACRNLVKKEPLLVMDILQINQYLYKDRKYYRKNYQ